MDIRKLTKNNKLEIKENIDGKRISFFGSGGILRYLVYPRNYIQLLWVVDCIEKFNILGRCSNTLISDDGSKDIIISTKRLNNISVKGDLIYAESGATIRDLSNIAKEFNLSGMERLRGIPGSLGGAIVMNAGAFGANMAGIIDYVDVIIDNRIEKLFVKDLGFGYRKSKLINNRGIVLGASIKLVNGNIDNIRLEEDKYTKLRIMKQPNGKSLGSVFMAYNGIPAAKYIEALNIKGMEIGGACLSEKHCNFIINKKNAKTKDYITLARYIQDKVYEKFNIMLRTELKYIGEANEDFGRLSYSYDI